MIIADRLCNPYKALDVDHRQAMQRALLLSFKVLVTAALIYWALRTVSIQAVTERLYESRPLWILSAIGAIIVQIVIQGIRWRIIVRASGFPFSLNASTRISFIAAFFNQSLPSTIGGDAARMWMLAREEGAGWRVASYSVLNDRIVGVCALALLVSVTLPWTFSIVQDPIAQSAVAAIAAFGVLGGIFFLSLSLISVANTRRIWGLRHLIAASVELCQLGRSPTTLILVATISLLVHVLNVAVAWLAAQSIDASVGFLYLLCLVPPIMLIAIAPVSIAGWGLREGLMVLVFSMAGLEGGDALVISILVGATSFVVGLIGGLVWITDRIRSP